MKFFTESRGGAAVDSESDEGCTLSDCQNTIEVEDVIEVEEVTTKRKRWRQAAANMDHQENVPAYLDGTLPDDLVQLINPPISQALIVPLSAVGTFKHWKATT